MVCAVTMLALGGRYNVEETRLKGLLRQKEMQLAERSRVDQYSHRARERSPADDLSVLKKEKRTLEATIERMQEEKRQQTQRVAEVHATLRKEKARWFKVPRFLRRTELLCVCVCVSVCVCACVCLSVCL